MNVFCYPSANHAGGASTLDARPVANRFADIRLSSYRVLLTGPMTSLAGNVDDRPDVRLTAILGYN